MVTIFLRAVTLLLAIFNAAMAAEPDRNSELDRVLVLISEKEPTLFGSNTSCKRNPKFWAEVSKTSLLSVLRKEGGVVELSIEKDLTVWFFPVSTCFTGSGPVGFLMVVRNGDNYMGLEGIRMAENIRIEGSKILFNETAYEGLCNEYRYLYTYDGKEFESKRLGKIESCK
jgi:hypothetical protein